MVDFVGAHRITGQGPPVQSGKNKTVNRAYPKVYQADKIIGNGSFGVVYKALQEIREEEANQNNQTSTILPATT